MIKTEFRGASVLTDGSWKRSGVIISDPFGGLLTSSRGVMAVNIQKSRVAKYHDIVINVFSLSLLFRYSTYDPRFEPQNPQAILVPTVGEGAKETREIAR